MKPPDEFELSLPRRCLPLFRCDGVDAPGGETANEGLPPGEELPGDRESGGAAYERVDVGLNGVPDALVGDVTVCVVESEVLVVIVRGCDVEDVDVVVVVVCAEGVREVGEPTVVVTVFAVEYVGLVRARKAEKKFEKNGLRLCAIVSVV